MKYPSSLIVLLFLIWATNVPTSAQNKRYLSYEPVVVELEGRLIFQEKFGGPNYGEQPSTDKKVKIPVLVLSRPVNVRGTPGDVPNDQTVERVARLQLLFQAGTPDKNFQGRKVTVRGTLFHSHTGHHYTDVLMNVISIHRKR